MIDLHTHTNQSDGTLSPAELVQAAVGAGIEALAITDHDTFAGFDEALPYAQSAGLELICGIELSTRMRGRSVHLLAYFIDHPPTEEFRQWILTNQASRRERNIRLAARLQSLGLDVTVEEAQAKGRNMTGRPHFAQVLVEKKYVASLRAAFDEYLDESAKGYVERREPTLAEGVQRVSAAGGLAVVAHPIRLVRSQKDSVDDWVEDMYRLGLPAIEVYHSDHSREEESHYLGLASRLGLAITGGSDFHGAAKPNVRLGSGTGNLNIPREILDRLRGVTNGRHHSA